MRHKRVFKDWDKSPSSCKTIKPGEEVCTDYTGDITYHTVIKCIPARSESGIVLSVSPAVKGSYSNQLDAAWFRSAEVGTEWHRLREIAEE